MSCFFVYDKNTGQLLRIKKNKPDEYSPVTFIDRHGYIVATASIDGKQYMRYAHRVIWFLCNGDIPDKMVIDHIDRNKLNNKITNLRLITQQQNLLNKNNKSSATKGTYKPSASKSWYAEITYKNKRYYLGCFKTRDEANAAFVDAKELLKEMTFS